MKYETLRTVTRVVHPTKGSQETEDIVNGISEILNVMCVCSMESP